MPDRRDGAGDHLGSGAGVERYQLWPAAFVDGAFSIPDVVLEGLWHEMERTGKTRDLFYNGLIRDAAGWLYWVKNPANYPVAVVDAVRNRISAVGWLNNAGDGAALAHFCVLGLPRPEMGRVVLRYWSNVKILRVLIGFTPESNVSAIKYAEKIGFKRSGYIPQMCNMAYEGRYEGAVVTTYLTQEEA